MLRPDRSCLRMPFCISCSRQYEAVLCLILNCVATFMFVKERSPNISMSFVTASRSIGVGVRNRLS